MNGTIKPRVQPIEIVTFVLDDGRLKVELWVNSICYYLAILNKGEYLPTHLQLPIILDNGAQIRSLPCIYNPET